MKTRKTDQPSKGYLLEASAGNHPSAAGGWNQIAYRFGGKLVSVDIIPINDLKDHVEGFHCWCKPEILELIVFSHNSMDGREAFETGERGMS